MILITMIRIVIDTNIALCGFLSYTSPERKIINYAMRKELTLVGSPDTLLEFSRKIDENQRFKKVAKDFMFPKSKLIGSYKSLIRLSQVPSEMLSRSFCIEDPDDDIFIKIALASSTKILVSNDKHLLKLNGIEGLRIINAKNLLPILDRNLKRS
jgi:putative PIN family toxin of toxin-antitoxin system